MNCFTKYKLFSFITLLLLSRAAYAQEKYVRQFKVKENVMYVMLSKNLPLSSLDSFVQAYSLAEIGLHTFLQTHKTDSLQTSGWKLDSNESPVFHYVLSRKIGSGTDVKKSGGRNIFSAIPTPDNWRIVGGNRVVYGANDFKNRNAFRYENGITYFFLRGFKKAKTVRLAGNFTNWQHGAFPLTRTADGWEAPVRLLPGQYFYKFILNDGEWTTDPDNHLSENDGMGNVNSVYFVPNKVFLLEGFETAKSVYLSGTFNNWAKNDLPLVKVATGWQIALYLEPGTHHFHFLVDGKIVKDSKEQQEQKLLLGKPSSVFILKGFANAKKVALAGEFNDWNPEEIFMNRTKEGWTIPYVLGPGNYQYKFIVDGKWITDPVNPNVVDDGKGNLNSFMVVQPNYTFRLKGHTAAKKVNLAGEFNNWSPQGLSMAKVGDEWVYPLYLGRGKHLYKFVVDGKWIKDPANPLWEDGDNNSVLWVE